MDTGKAVRLATVLRPDGRTFIGALDVLIPRGPLRGLRDPVATARLFVGAGVDALLMHEGLVDVCLPAFAGRAGLIIKLTTASWQSEDSTRRVQVTSVRRAVSLGASAVAANCFIGVPHDGELLAQLGRIADACVEYGIPLIPLINPHKYRTAENSLPEARAERLITVLYAISLPYTSQPHQLRSSKPNRSERCRPRSTAFGASSKLGWKRSPVQVRPARPVSERFR